MRLLFCLSAAAMTTGCALFPQHDRVTDFPVGDGRHAIVVEGDEYDSPSDLLLEFHHRAWELCPSGRYTFETDVGTDASREVRWTKVDAGPRNAITGYVRCTADAAEASAARAAVRSSRVIERNGQQCIQALDADGTVIEESCAGD